MSKERTPGQLETLYRVESGVAWVTLDRPQVRNALSGTLVREVFDHLHVAFHDDAVRAVALTGAGKGFCAGADLKNPPGKTQGSERAVSYPELLTTIMEGPKPVIAAINGPAFAGGLGLVGAADIVISAREATFSFSEVRIGVIPAIISVVCMPKLGQSRCMRLFLTGERFDAEAAVSWGLVHEAVPLADLGRAVQSEVDAIRLGGPNAVAECKKLVRKVGKWSVEEGLTKTPPWSAELFRTAEAQEGMAAFREKRPPSWVSEAADGASSNEESCDES